MGNNTRIATLLNGAISLLAVVAITLVCIVPTAFAEDGANTSDAPGAGADNSVEQIAGPVPNIIITNFTYGDGSVAVGSTFNLGFTFQNMGKVAVSNMVVTVDGGENFAISGGTNTFYYDALNAGAALTQTVPMQTLASAKNGAQGIDISFKYEYVDGAARSSNTSDIKISVPVSQPDRFELNDPVVPNIVNAGELEHKRSVAIDKILTGKYTALPCFAGIMALVFWLTFGVVGSTLSDWMTLGIDWFTGVVDRALTAYQINPVVHSLVIDGIFAGVGSVLSFLPTIVILFFFLSILEDTGYMARVAFVMDKLLRRIGLSGRSFVPMLVGFGCSVPAIMATRTLSSERDRRMTILLTPFMSCSAKLPIYALFTAAFFPRVWRAPVMIFLYLFGILCGILYSLILKQTCFRGEPVPFVMELPNYRLPSPKSVGQLIWEKARDFIQRAFTIIFVATVVIWFLQTFDTRLNVAATPDSSLLALVGSLITPIFKPLGFGDWRISTALITGFTAKESVVSTLTVLLGGDTGALNTLFNPFTALVFLIFTLLYTPCVAAIAAVKRELGGGRAALGVVLMQCGIAWVVAFAVHCVGVLLGLA